MYVIHEIAPESIASVRSDGLSTTRKGEKSNDTAIQRANTALDNNRPADVVKAGVSRENANYGYYLRDNVVTDITDGQTYSMSRFLDRSSKTVLLLEINPTRCYVSDLDTFDDFKELVEAESTQDIITQKATEYWQRVVTLSQYKAGDFLRPEIIIPYDIPPQSITILKQVYPA